VAQALGARGQVQVLPAAARSAAARCRWTAAQRLHGHRRTGRRQARGRLPERLAEALRALPIPVIGRIEDGQLRLDLRCLDGAVSAFLASFLSIFLSDAALAAAAGFIGAPPACEAAWAGMAALTTNPATRADNSLFMNGISVRVCRAAPVGAGAIVRR
jgi:predicted nucleic acid-binding protein